MENCFDISTENYNNILEKLKINSYGTLASLKDNNTTTTHRNTNDGLHRWRTFDVTVDVDTTVNSISFADIGYKEGDVITLGDVSKLDEDLNYSKRLMDSNPTTLRDDKNLVYAPYIDLSEKTDLGSFYRNCSSLINVPPPNISNLCTNIDSFFNHNSKIKYIDLSQSDLSKVLNMNGTFYGLTNLETVIFPTGDKTTKNNRNFDATFYTCKKLKHIKGELDFILCYKTNYCFESCYELEEVWIKNWFDDDIWLKDTKIEWECIKYLIDNALYGNSRELRLNHSRHYNEFTQKDEYQYYLNLATEKNIIIVYM